MNERSFWDRYNPRVPRRWLFLLAGLIWTGVGTLLCLRALGWYTLFPPSLEYPMEGTGVVLAVAGYTFGFSKISHRNITRIHGLPERVCLFAFTAWRGYIMIALMVTLGLLLRNSSIPKQYLALPYLTMGGTLLLGSIPFYRTFFTAGHPGR